MATRENIERIAALVARIEMTDSDPERIAATRGAYARMKRDGVTCDELLSLPDAMLYQRGLMALVGHMVEVSEDLSAPAKRELYAKLSAQVSARFSGGNTRSGGSSPPPPTPPPYHSPAPSPSPHSERSSSSDGFSATDWKGRGVAILHTVIAFTGAFFTWSGKEPQRAFRVLMASALFGFGGGLFVLSCAGLLHAVLGIGGPWIDMNIRTAWVLVGIPLGVWRLVRTLTR